MLDETRLTFPLPQPDGSVRDVRIELLDDTMIAVFRSWSPSRKLKALDDYFLLARDLVEGSVRTAHPGWSAEEVRTEVSRRMIGQAD